MGNNKTSTTNARYILSVGLATTTILIAALFAGGLLLSRPSFTALVAQAGLISDLHLHGLEQCLAYVQ